MCSLGLFRWIEQLLILWPVAGFPSTCILFFIIFNPLNGFLICFNSLDFIFFWHPKHQVLSHILLNLIDAWHSALWNTVGTVLCGLHILSSFKCELKYLPLATLPTYIYLPVCESAVAITQFSKRDCFFFQCATPAERLKILSIFE